VPSGFGMKVLLTEYAKFLAARVRLFVMADTPEASVTAHAVEAGKAS
jgi:hypothetical protein